MDKQLSEGTSETGEHLLLYAPKAGVCANNCVFFLLGSPWTDNSCLLLIDGSAVVTAEAQQIVNKQLIQAPSETG